jgi:hypothetical protein
LTLFTRESARADIQRINRSDTNDAGFLRAPRRPRAALDRLERGETGAAFVDADRLAYTVLGDRFFKVTPG